MQNKNKQNVALDKEDIKKLEKYKIHPKQPYWEVIKNILNEKEAKKK